MSEAAKPRSFSRAEWPHGLRCMDCDERFEDGQQISSRLVAVTLDGEPMSELVCVPCGLGIGA